MVNEKQPITRFRTGMLQIGLIIVALFLISRFDYLLFHSLAEFIVASIGIAIFMLSWNSRKFSRNNFFPFIGIGLLSVAILSIFHSLAYEKMGVFPGTDGNPDLATRLWVASQYVLAVTFVFAPFALKRKINVATIFLFFSTILIFVFLSIFFWNNFPVAYIPGTGQTPFKIISEYFVAGLFLLSLYLFWMNRRFMEKRMMYLLFFTVSFLFLSNLSFTHYIEVFDFFNMLGHQFRIIAFYGSYLAFVELGLMRPYNNMFREVTKRESKLKKSKEEWERTFDSVPDLIAILDTNHKIVRANKAMTERLKTDPDECIGLNCYECVHGANSPIDACPHSLTIKDGKEHISEVKEDRLGGTFLVSTTPFFDNGGKLIGSVHVARDITERKQMEQRLESLAKFPLENPNPVMRVSSEGKIMYANPSARNIMRDLRISIGQTFPEEWRNWINTSLEQNKKQVFEMAIGNKIYSIEISPVVKGNYVNLYARDVTGRRKAESALMREKEKFARILDNMEDSVYTVTESYEITYTNPAFRKYFGKNIGNSRCFEFLYGRESPCPWCMNKEVFSGKTVRWECFFSKINKTFDIIETPMDMANGELVKMEIMRDITEKKRIEKTKDDFISLASHQLRTPLSAISLSSELLLRGISGDMQKEQKEYLEEIHKATKRMTLLVNNLLNVSRLEMGTFSVEAEPLDIISSAREKLKEFSPAIFEKEIKIEEDIELSIAPIKFNANSFEIVFDNLVSNAIRYTPKGGRIKISIKKNGNNAILSVADTGYGIPKGLEDKVFEKSFRAENAQKISSEGAGLGLYMVKSIADLTGSKIWFDSKEKKGTTFYFSIPIR